MGCPLTSWSLSLSLFGSVECRKCENGCAHSSRTLRLFWNREWTDNSHRTRQWTRNKKIFISTPHQEPPYFTRFLPHTRKYARSQPLVLQLNFNSVLRLAVLTAYKYTLLTRKYLFSLITEKLY